MVCQPGRAPAHGRASRPAAPEPPRIAADGGASIPEITLLKNQMKSAMMAKPADKNIQSGNSRVKVTIYGQVNTAFRVASAGGESQYQSVSNDGSSPRIGIRAVGQVNKNVSIVGWHEVEWQYNRRSATGVESDGNERLRARHVDLSLSHKELGTLSIGKGSIAGDAADLYSLSGTGYVFGFGGPSGNDGGVLGGRSWVFGAFFGARQNRIRYQTPRVAGAMLEASVNENDSISFGALYSGAPPGVKDFRALLRAGYRSDPNKHTMDTDRVTSWGVSGGIGHSSGFTVSGSYGTTSEKGSMVKPYKWNVEVGWAGKINDMGKTAITVGYGNYNDGMYGDAKYYYFAVNQAIDSAAADVYFGVSNDTGTVTGVVTPAVEGMAGSPAMPAYITARPTDPAFAAPGEGTFRTAYTVNAAATWDHDGDAATAEVPIPALADGTTIATADLVVHAGATDLTTTRVALFDPDGTTASTALPASHTFTYNAATEAVEAVEAQDAVMGAVDRDGVLVFIAGVRIKF